MIFQFTTATSIKKCKKQFQLTQRRIFSATHFGGQVYKTTPTQQTDKRTAQILLGQFLNMLQNLNIAIQKWSSDTTLKNGAYSEKPYE
jgi:hypothetical protein